MSENNYQPFYGQSSEHNNPNPFPTPGVSPNYANAYWVKENPGSATSASRSRGISSTPSGNINPSYLAPNISPGRYDAVQRGYMTDVNKRDNWSQKSFQPSNDESDMDSSSESDYLPDKSSVASTHTGAGRSSTKPSRVCINRTAWNAHHERRRRKEQHRLERTKASDARNIDTLASQSEIIRDQASLINDLMSMHQSLQADSANLREKLNMANSLNSVLVTQVEGAYKWFTSYSKSVQKETEKVYSKMIDQQSQLGPTIQRLEEQVRFLTNQISFGSIPPSSSSRNDSGLPENTFDDQSNFDHSLA